MIFRKDYVDELRRLTKITPNPNDLKPIDFEAFCKDFIVFDGMEADKLINAFRSQRAVRGGQKEKKELLKTLTQEVIESRTGSQLLELRKAIKRTFNVFFLSSYFNYEEYPYSIFFRELDAIEILFTAFNQLITDLELLKKKGSFVFTRDEDIPALFDSTGFGIWRFGEYLEEANV